MTQHQPQDQAATGVACAECEGPLQLVPAPGSTIPSRLHCPRCDPPLVPDERGEAEPAG
jgi:hypothetical protein